MRNKRSVVLLALAFTLLMSLPAFAYEAFKGPIGILQNVPAESYAGYTLITPQASNTTYLIDNDGNIINTWKSEYKAFISELLPNGNLLRHGVLPGVTPNFGGSGGIYEEFDWSGKKVWEYQAFEKGSHVGHHLFHRMPNGNTLILVWEMKSFDDAIAKGRDLNHPDNKLTKEGIKTWSGDTVEGIWPDAVWEISPKGEKVWSWSSWDHVGTGEDQLDVNYVLPFGKTGMDAMSGPDWTHWNGVDYDEVNDKVLINSRNFGEFYVIDHKTGKMEYRWGNPSTHGKGKAPAGYLDDGDQKLFGPHGAVFLENGNISVLDNGTARPSGTYTRAVEVDPKTSKVVWQFSPSLAGAESNSFYSAFQCGAQKLPNNNWLITASANGHMIEVTPERKIVWEAVNPVVNDVIYATTNSVGAMGQGLAIHKSFRYGKDYAAFAGKDMAPKGEKFPNWVKVLSENPAPENKKR